MADVSAVVIGAGVNGLVAATILARAGAQVQVLEAADEIGGAGRTVSFGHGYRAPLGPDTLPAIASDILWATGVDLTELRLRPAAHSLSVTEGGRILSRHADRVEDARALAALDRADADAMPVFEALLSRLAARIRPLLFAPLPDTATRAGVLTRPRQMEAALGALEAQETADCARLLVQSLRDRLDRSFRSDDLKGLIAGRALAGVGRGPYAPLTAAHLLRPWLGSGPCVPATGLMLDGGLKALAGALARALAEAGGSLRLSAPVRGLTLANDRVTGAVLDSGEEIPADLLVSSLDPAVTLSLLVEAGAPAGDLLLDLVGEPAAGAPVRLAFGLDRRPGFALLPERFRARPGLLHLSQSMASLEAAHDEARAGQVPSRPWADLCVSSDGDPGLAPAEGAVLTATLYPLPQHLAEGPWDEAAREGLLDRITAEIDALSPGFRNLVRARAIWGAGDWDTLIGAGTTGPYQGDLGLERLWSARPLPELSQYRLPVRNGYLCGSGVHPGPLVLGAPGYNAARRILGDLRGLRAA
ncbi:MAG: NAD(P)/FAD-dependent oxidoreductase [Alphaproteobacteria bacterium]|nr:NAD(P)/FAD-dependent oxidoreductase [Alphaproteobacteria bacterium]